MDHFWDKKDLRIINASVMVDNYIYSNNKD